VLVVNTEEFVPRIVFDPCGVEVTEKKVRRDRVGHINFMVPVAQFVFPFLPKK